MQDDVQLLREFVEGKSEDAFSAIVERHAGMVHGTALRLVHDAALADEVSQAVFILLARKSAALPAGTVLAGWLYQTTRFVARSSLRAEHRRQQHHRDFASMNDHAESSTTWEQIKPHLDDAIARLAVGERDALVLRFLEGRSFAEVGTALGTSEAAAKMRVSRALDKLRHAFRPGAVLTVSALAAALTAHSTTAPPAAVISQITNATLATSTPEANLLPLVNETLKLMMLQKLKAATIAAFVALLFIASGVTLYVLSTKPAHSPATALLVATFEPMAGEWEGTFETRGDGMPAPRPQNVTLTIRTSAQGRVCEIDMNLFDWNNQPPATFHFSHELNATGNRIITRDDPRTGRLSHDGQVIEASHDHATGEWRAAFRATRPGREDVTECHWSRRGDDLKISRQDVTASPQSTNTMFSEIILRRKAG